MPSEETPVAEDLIAAPAPEPYPFWGWADFAIVIGLLIGLIAIIFFVAGGFTYFIPSLKTDPAPLLLPVQLAFYGAIYLAFLLAFRFRYDKPVFSSLGWKRTVSNKTLAYIGLSGVLLSPAISLIASLLHTPEVHMDALDQLEKYPVILAIFGIMAVTVAPLFEELLFRGFLQPLFSKTFGFVAGILITGLLFGLLHSIQYKNVWQYVAAVSFVGIVLGAVRYRTGSIIPSTLMHACYNSVAAIGIFFHHK
jgi:membrane protease YdiL (CAAX protease family)